MGCATGRPVAADLLRLTGRLCSNWGAGFDRYLGILVDPFRRAMLGAIQNLLADWLGFIPEEATASRSHSPQSIRWVAYHLERRDSGVQPYSQRECDLLDLWAAVLESCGWWWPCENVCVIAERATAVANLRRGQLHCDHGPVIRFRDGFSLWYLHDVPVPWWLVELPEGEIDPRWLVTISNLLLDLGDRRMRPYLKMLNPSIGTWHVEGVTPSCTTVLEALAWRNGTDQPPAKLT
ncbi:MAG: hypothetical protein NTW87_04815 [Planctomycetota bacterium]|nr:hypothetical protein [Planctomycetota bacterium]